MSVSVRDRFAAIEIQRLLETRGDRETARAIDDARYAESFPGSYTADAVSVSRSMIAACRTRDLAPVRSHAETIRSLQETDGWYA